MEDRRTNRRHEVLEQLKKGRQTHMDNAFHFSNAEKTKRLRQTRQGAMLWYKMTHACADCGISDPRVLEFDHVKGEKKFVLQKAKTKSFDKILTEIEKCDVVCANCHRIRTQERMDENSVVTIFSSLGLGQ